jgi:hypothetical protein
MARKEKKTVSSQGSKILIKLVLDDSFTPHPTPYKTNTE